MALTTNKILKTLSLLGEEPDVLSRETLIENGMESHTVEILAANHEGGITDGGHRADPSIVRYAGGIFQVDPLLVDARGVYTPDLLVHLAGVLGVSLVFPYETVQENYQHAQTVLREACLAR
jgi:hypothetical protein